MIDIDLAKAQRLVNEAIELKGPEYVYPKQGSAGGSCYYVHSDRVFNDETDEWIYTNQTPGCLVGYALHFAGVELELLREHNEDSAAGILSTLVGLGLVDVSAEAVDYLNYAQCSQDKGATWGEADAHAKLGEVWRENWEDSGWVSYKATYGGTPSEEYGREFRSAKVSLEK